MLISDQQQFIFIHIEKNAGTSITSALQPYSIVQPVSKWSSILRMFDLPRDYTRYKYPRHAGLCEAQKIMPGEKFEQYFKFAFVRNPWDRLVSEYNAAIKKNRRRRHKKIKAMSDFNEYVDYEVRRNKLAQLPKILNQQGEMGLDYIGRFEKLNEDFSYVCQTVGIDVTLIQKNAFKHQDYRQYYNDETQAKVRQHWAEDIEVFGYEF